MAYFKNLNFEIRTRLVFTILVILYVMALLLSVKVLSQTWYYQGIHFYPLSLINIIFIIPCLIIPIFKFDLVIKKPSQLVLILLYFFIYIPYFVVPFVINKAIDINENIYIYLIVTFLCFIFLQTKFRFSKSDRFSIINLLPTITLRQFYIIVGIILLISLFLVVRVYGFKITFIHLEDIYNIRDAYKEETQSNSIVAYIVLWMAYVINPFLFLLGVSTKNKYLIIIGVLLQLYLFSLAAFKSHIALFIVLIILYLVLNKKSLLRTTYIAMLFVLIPVLFLFLYFIFDIDNYILTLVVRRILVVPAQLSYYYLDFFSTHPKTYLGYGIFKNLVEYPYNMTPPHIIGEVYFGKRMSANVGFLPDGFSAFGYIGMFIMTFLMKWVVNLFDSIYMKSKQNLLVLVFVISFSYVFTNSSLLTVFLTHGLIVLIIILSIYPWNRVQKNK